MFTAKHSKGLSSQPHVHVVACLLAGVALGGLLVRVLFSLELGFLNCGTRTTTGTLTVDYWYAVLIKNRNMKKDTIKK
jgi:hypothetical protein